MLCVSFCSFGTQFIFQALFLMELNAYHMRYSNTFLFQVQIYLSGNFNIEIFMYMVTTTIYSLGGIFENWSTATISISLLQCLVWQNFYIVLCCMVLSFFYIRDHAASLTSGHTSESVMKQKSYGRTYDYVECFGSKLQFVSTEHFTAVK